jgi:hypothetical protein
MRKETLASNSISGETVLPNGDGIKRFQKKCENSLLPDLPSRKNGRKVSQAKRRWYQVAIRTYRKE